jgi:hypothetical protein
MWIAFLDAPIFVYDVIYWQGQRKKNTVRSTHTYVISISKRQHLQASLQQDHP